MFSWLFLGMLFVFVMALTFSVYAWLLERRQRAETYSAQADEPVSHEAMILGPLTSVVAAPNSPTFGRNCARRVSIIAAP